MAALLLLVLLVSTICAGLLQPIIHFSGAVLMATWLIWLPLVAALWLLLADNPAGGNQP